MKGFLKVSMQQKIRPHWCHGPRTTIFQNSAGRGSHTRTGPGRPLVACVVRWPTVLAHHRIFTIHLAQKSAMGRSRFSPSFLFDHFSCTLRVHLCAKYQKFELESVLCAMALWPHRNTMTGFTCRAGAGQLSPAPPRGARGGRRGYGGRCGHPKLKVTRCGAHASG